MKRSAEAVERIEQRRERLEQSRRVALPVAVAERFFEIAGATQASLVSIYLFTTVIPMMIIGFAYFSGFAANASLGDLFIRNLGLQHPLDDRVREAFGASSGIRSTWTFFGVGAFLVWGIPMSITVAGMFGRAWRRRPFGLTEKLARGSIWFILYLATIAARDRIGFAFQQPAGVRVALLTVALVPVWIFWSLTPVLLVRDGGRGWRDLLRAGVAGVIIDGIVLASVVRVGFPIMLKGWTGFGPIGVAMTLMTWCGLLATGWVAIACTGALLWERNAPAQIVVKYQTAESPDASGGAGTGQTLDIRS